MGEFDWGYDVNVNVKVKNWAGTSGRGGGGKGGEAGRKEGRKGDELLRE